MNSNDPLLPPGVEVPDGRDIASRRAYMAAVFKFPGPYSDEKMAEERSLASKLNCAYLHQKHKLTKIGHLLFEYMTDNAIWHNWFVDRRKAGKPTPKWPWTGVRPDRDEVTEGISPIYTQWLRHNAPELELASVHPSVPVAPEAISSPTFENTVDRISAPLFPAAASGTALPQISAPLSPPVPCLVARQHVWKVMCGDSPNREPACGPFEIRVYRQPPDEYDSLFSGAQELIPPQLAISWMAEGPTCKLILGFARDIDHHDLVNQSLLLASWGSAMSWARLVRIGGSMTLATYLRDSMRAKAATIIHDYNTNG